MREFDCYAWTCEACHREVETPVHSAGSKLKCLVCGAAFEYLPHADADDMPDDVRGAHQWRHRELTAEQADAQAA